MDKKILVMVDMQTDHIDRTHPLVTKFKELLSANIFEVVIATEYIGIRNGPVESILGRKGPEHDLIVPDLLPYVDETIQKCTFCHFDAIKGVLQAHNTGHNVPEQAWVAGMDTDTAVLITAMTLVDHYIRPIVLSGYCWSEGGKEYHEAGLNIIRRSIGANNVI